MTRIAYEVAGGRHAGKRFNAEQLTIIEHVNRELGIFRRLQIDVTLRSIYYRLIGGVPGTRDMMPDSWCDPEYNKKHGLPPTTKNTLKNYKRLVDLVAAARLAGLVSWQDLKDNLRSVERMSHWDSPVEWLDEGSYHIDKWQDQPQRVEVWAEKDAVEGVLKRICPSLDVPYFVSRGFPSLTVLWDAAQRLQRYRDEGQEPVILYLGDHDPSGMDIPRGMAEYLELFTGEEVEIKRLALNMDQVREFYLPPNPAKTTDSRFAGYEEKYGDESWELDALLGVDPMMMIRMIEEGVAEHRDDDLFRQFADREDDEKDVLRGIKERFDDVAAFLRAS